MEELLKEVSDYLESKIPEVEKSTRDEISTYLVHRFAIHEINAIDENNMEWKRSLINRRIEKVRRDIFRSSICPSTSKGENNDSRKGETSE